MHLRAILIYFGFLGLIREFLPIVETTCQKCGTHVSPKLPEVREMIPEHFLGHDLFLHF